MRSAVFLDRDGVLVEDVDLLTRTDQLRVLAGVPASLIALREAGFALVVVSNQPVVARGLATEAEVQAIHVELGGLIRAAGGPDFDQVYFCPHHPNATLPAYRVDCDCRKPKPGMLLRAARELSLDLRSSFLVGDRLTDIIAGARAGCRTVLGQTGKHLDRPIETNEPLDTTIRPDHTCADLPAAVGWILHQ
ncbi:MAG: HAD family hydrolase [Verrucomicrobia bacterium]|nr:HAD family hydrolase [Verrucomicrobiota bacterium]